MRSTLRPPTMSTHGWHEVRRQSSRELQKADILQPQSVLQTLWLFLWTLFIPRIHKQNSSRWSVRWSEDWQLNPPKNKPSYVKLLLDVTIRLWCDEHVRAALAGSRLVPKRIVQSLYNFTKRSTRPETAVSQIIFQQF